ncbi:MAG: protein kinase [Planctomycetia bacterium]|nr:protein kinase [Planctomycetia bacterium]
MRASPPSELVDLLGRLELATAAEVRAAHRHARRLAHDLTGFDSVWVDALVQARRLAPYQAAEINARRGDGLRVGPYAITAPLRSPAYARSYRAREVATGRKAWLTVGERQDAADPAAALEEVIRRAAACSVPQIVPIEKCGTEGTPLWVAHRSVEGRSAAAWLVHSGRMPPQVVLEVARQMAVGLLALEAAGIAHGDVSAQTLVLDPVGIAQLILPGLRPVIRPIETQNAEGLPAEAFDYLAPERARDGGPSSIAADIYACGVLWWQLLAGRPPLVGACGVAKLRAAQSPRIPDIRPIEPDTPPPLAAAIAACTQPEVQRRPATIAALLEVLGPSSDRGQALVARYLSRGAGPPERLIRRIRTVRRSPNAPVWVAVAGGALLATSIVGWPLVSSRVLGDAAATIAVEQGAGPVVALPPPRTGPAPIDKATNQPQSNVVLAAVAQPLTPRGAARNVSPGFLLTAVRPIPWSSVRPLAGQVVHGRPGERPRIVVPASGGDLNVDGVRFEGVDFLCDRSRNITARLFVGGQNVTFRDCSFQGVGLVIVSSLPNQEAPAPHSGSEAAREIALSDCVLEGVATGIRCLNGADCSVTLSNVLHVGPGPLVELDAPRAGQSALVRLWHCTVRDAACFLEVRDSDSAEPRGTIRVEAEGCVFAPRADGAVIAVESASTPAVVLRSIGWAGQESVVPPEAPLAVWRRRDGTRRTIAEKSLAIEGLVRSAVGFAGDLRDGRDASRLVRWQVPLRSEHPPGIGELRVLSPSTR